MKKKIFAIVLACMMIFTMVPATVFAEGDADHEHEEHVHEFVEEVITAATCTEKGAVRLTCECGYSYIKITPATGHNFDEGKVTVDPTCTEKGVKTYTCSVCGETYTEELPATEHKFDEGKVTVDPTCTDKGLKTYTCTVCGETYTEEIPAIGHNYVPEVFDPTCTEEGKTVYTCTVCGDSYETATKPVIPHDYEAVITDATCTENGTIVYTCKNCEDTYTDVIRAFGHSYQLTNSKPATCTTKGVKTYTCSVCGDTYTVQSAPTGHSYTTTVLFEATCVDDGVLAYICDTCGETHKVAIPATHIHEYEETEYTSENGKYTYRPCTMCDDILVTQGWGEIPEAAGISKRIKATVTLTSAVSEKITLTVTVDASNEDLTKYTDLKLDVNGTVYALSAEDFTNGVYTKDIEFSMINIIDTFTAVLTATNSGVACTTAETTYAFGRVDAYTDDSAKIVEFDGATASITAEGLSVYETVSLVYHVEINDATKNAILVLTDANGKEYAKVALNDSLIEDGVYVVRVPVNAENWTQVFAATLYNAENEAISSTYYFSVSAYAARHITDMDLNDRFLEILRAMMAVEQ